MADMVREPKQQRSIEKKNKIIEAGYQLFAEVGYFSTNTAEIAKKAGVSTGIVYGYFRDKRDILLEVMEIYIQKVFQPVFQRFESLKAPLDFSAIFSSILDEIIATHNKNASIHQALHSMTHTDELIERRFLELEDEMTKAIAEALERLGYTRPDIFERVHLAINIVQSHAHECVYDKHAYLDYKVLREKVITLLCQLFD